MKPKNVMLLGFVNKAVDYLDNNFDSNLNSSLAELQNIDLVALKDALDKNLNSSLGTMTSTVQTLIEAGEEAFDKFMNLNSERTNSNNLLNEIDRIFDVKLDDDVSFDNNDIGKLLQFYSLDEDREKSETKKEVRKPSIDDQIPLTKIEKPANDEKKTLNNIEVASKEVEKPSNYVGVMSSDSEESYDDIEIPSFLGLYKQETNVEETKEEPVEEIQEEVQQEVNEEEPVILGYYGQEIKDVDYSEIKQEKKTKSLGLYVPKDIEEEIQEEQLEEEIIEEVAEEIQEEVKEEVTQKEPVTLGYYGQEIKDVDYKDIKQESHKGFGLFVPEYEEEKVEEEKKEEPVTLGYYGQQVKDVDYSDIKQEERNNGLGLFIPTEVEVEQPQEEFVGFYEQEVPEINYDDYKLDEPVVFEEKETPVVVEEEPEFDDQDSDFEEEETKFEMSEEDDELMKIISENVANNEDSIAEVSEDVEQEDVQGLDDVFDEVVTNQEEDDTSAPEVNTITKQDIINLVKDLQNSNELYFNNVDVDSIYREVEQDHHDLVDIAQSNYDVDTNTNYTDTGYVSSLIDDLRTRMIEEDEAKKAAQDEFNRVYENISKTYPNLPFDFVKSAYELRDSLDDEYPEGTDIVILHRIKFNDVDNLRQFVDIALNHNYAINADESKMIVDVFKQYTNTNGRIITTIYEVANQAIILNGEYEGYKVLDIEKDKQ